MATCEDKLDYVYSNFSSLIDDISTIKDIVSAVNIRTARIENKITDLSMEHDAITEVLTYLTPLIENSPNADLQSIKTFLGLS